MKKKIHPKRRQELGEGTTYGGNKHLKQNKRKKKTENTQRGGRNQFEESIIIINVNQLNFSFAKIVETFFL